jgi:pimeloyl-ACP methyl ester carboxylesterase
MGDSGSRGRRGLPGMSSQGGDRVGESAPEIRDREVNLNGSQVHYLAAGDGPHLVLLHGLRQRPRLAWVMPALARRSRVIAPDFPGFGESDRPRAAYSPAFFGEFVAGFLDALHVPGAVVAGNSLGGLAALRFALADPGRVPALVLVDSAGLGREVNPGMRLTTLPGLGESAAAWARTRPGRALRLWWRPRALFAHRRRVPAGWIADQDRLSRRPDFPWNTLEVLRAVVGRSGQREVLRDPPRLVARAPRGRPPGGAEPRADHRRLAPVRPPPAAGDRLRRRPGPDRRIRGRPGATRRPLRSDHGVPAVLLLRAAEACGAVRGRPHRRPVRPRGRRVGEAGRGGMAVRQPGVNSSGHFARATRLQPELARGAAAGVVYALVRGWLRLPVPAVQRGASTFTSREARARESRRSPCPLRVRLMTNRQRSPYMRDFSRVVTLRSRSG